MKAIDGFYAAYISGKAGEGILFLVFREQDVVGCDLAGFEFDGTCIPAAQKSAYDVHVRVSTSANRETVQGQNTGPSGLKYDLDFEIPEDFESLPFLSVSTPLGPVNMRLEKVRDLGFLAK